MLCVDSVIYTRNSLKNYKLKPRKEGLRFKVFTKNDIQKRDYNLDIFWIRHEDPSRIIITNLWFKILYNIMRVNR